MRKHYIDKSMTDDTIIPYHACIMSMMKQYIVKDYLGYHVIYINVSYIFKVKKAFEKSNSVTNRFFVMPEELRYQTIRIKEYLHFSSKIMGI